MNTKTLTIDNKTVTKTVSLFIAFMFAFMTAFILNPNQAFAVSNDYVIDNANTISQSTADKLKETNDSNSKAPKVYIYTAEKIPSGVTSSSQLAQINDNLIKTETKDPSNSILLVLYTKDRKISLRYGGNISRGITAYLTESNVYNSESKTYLASGDFDNGMRTAASNVFNYVNAGYNSGNMPANNQNANKKGITVPWKGIGAVLLGIMGAIMLAIGALFGFASMGQAKNSRESIKLIKKYANKQRFGSEAYNSRYSDDAWAAAIIKYLNDNDELQTVTSDKTAKAACYSAGRKIYLNDGLKYDLSTCDYYDASIDYTEQIRDTDIEADNFNLQEVVSDVNSKAKAGAADRKRLDDAINDTINLLKGRTQLTQDDIDRITAELHSHDNDYLIGNVSGERKPNRNAMNEDAEKEIIRIRANSYSRKFLSENAFKKEDLFDTDGFIDETTSYIIEVGNSGEQGRILNNQMDSFNDYMMNMFAKYNQDAKKEQERRDKAEQERKEREEQERRNYSAYNSQQPMMPMNMNMQPNGLNGMSMQQQGMPMNQQMNMPYSRPENAYRSGNGIGNALLGGAIGYGLGRLMDNDNHYYHDDHYYHNDYNNGFDSGFGFSNDDNDWGGGFDSSFDDNNDDGGFDSDFGGGDDGGFDSDF